MGEATIEDLAITTLFGGGTASGSLPPLLGLRPATKGAYPLGTPDSVSPNVVVLRGNLTHRLCHNSKM
jgi:hypothetical protein